MRSARVPLLALALAAGFGAAAHAASPFGVGLPEPAPSAGGFLPELFAWIAEHQRAFYRSMTAAVAAMKSDGTAGLWLMGLAFAYGVLHAAGPGHGKAIVSAYVLANRETARNGAILSLLSALAQGVTAVALVSIAAGVLGATSMAMTRTAEWLEIGSFLLITGLGLWLVWRKIVKPAAAFFETRYAPAVVSVGHGAMAMNGPALAVHRHVHDHHGHDHTGHDHSGHGGHKHHDHHHGQVHGQGHAHDHHHGHDHSACCGHVHAPSLEQASGTLDLRKAWTTIAAVGLRPCTGALIILVFALSQGLYAAGIAATFAMALGTGLTVAALTLLAVSARGIATGFTGAETALAHRLHRGFEATGALVVLAFGLLMLGAALSG